MTNLEEFRIVAQLELRLAGVTLPIHDEQAAYRHLAQRAASIGRPVTAAVEDSPSYGLTVDAAKNVSYGPTPDEPDAKIVAKRWSLTYEKTEVSAGRALAPLVRTAESMAERLGGTVKIVGFAGPHAPHEAPLLTETHTEPEAAPPAPVQVAPSPAPVTVEAALPTARAVSLPTPPVPPVSRTATRLSAGEVAALLSVKAPEQSATPMIDPAAFYAKKSAPPTYGGAPERQTAWPAEEGSTPDAPAPATATHKVISPAALYGTPTGYGPPQAPSAPEANGEDDELGTPTPLPTPGQEPLVNAWVASPNAEDAAAQPWSRPAPFDEVIAAAPLPSATLDEEIVWDAPENNDTERATGRSRMTSARTLIIAGAVLAVVIVVAMVVLMLPHRLADNNGQAAPTSEASPIVEGYSPNPTAVFDPHDDGYAISDDQQRLAVLTDGQTLRIQPTTALVDAKVEGTEGLIKKLDKGQSFSTDIYPLGTTGFAVLMQTSQSLGAAPTLLTWTPKDGAKEHKLNSGDTLASRAGSLWVTSKINTGRTAPRLVTSTSLITFSTPGTGPALLGFASESQAIWASLSADSTPRLVLADVKGKVAEQNTIAGTKKGYSVARWIAATGTNALILWQLGDTYTLALHDTKTGKLVTSTDYSLPTETNQPAEVPVSASADGTLLTFGTRAVNVAEGKFLTLDGSGGAKDITVKPGGYQLTLTDGTALFLRRDGSKAPLPMQGDLVAISDDAALTESSQTLTIYPSLNNKE